MDADLFWTLLDDLSGLGKLVAAVPSDGASANLVGRLRLGRDGGERVLERPECRCHIHLQPERVHSFRFTLRDPGFGPEPCVEALTAEGHLAMRLYYLGEEDAPAACRAFLARHAAHAACFEGSW